MLNHLNPVTKKCRAVEPNAALILSVNGAKCSPGLGLDINVDIAGTGHFGGPANQDANGNYYVMDLNGSVWGIVTVVE